MDVGAGEVGDVETGEDAGGAVDEDVLGGDPGGCIEARWGGFRAGESLRSAVFIDAEERRVETQLRGWIHCFFVFDSSWIHCLSAGNLWRSNDAPVNRETHELNNTQVIPSFHDQPFLILTKGIVSDILTKNPRKKQ
jgi:hypothetical protein